MIKENITEEEICLEPLTELFEEARKIAVKTIEDEKFSFVIQYDGNNKKFFLSVLKALGAEIEAEDEKVHALNIRMNMEQLKLIKGLDCVERISSDESTHALIANEIANATPADEFAETNMEITMESADNVSKTLGDVAVASISSNTTMASAKTITVNTSVYGCICCPGSEQWFQFTVKRTGQYTILTTGSLDTIGTLYDCCGNQIVEVDDYAPCGKLNFRIIRTLTAGCTYYVKVRIYGDNTGSYTLRVTDRVFANYVTINKSSFTLEKGVTYELPITPNYIYKGYNGALRIPGLSVSINPSNANEQKIWWWEQYSDVLNCSYGWDDDGDRYIHITATGNGTEKLYAEDWNENGKRDECMVTVLTPYEKMLQDLGGFSNEVIRLILNLYERIDTAFTSENTLQKAWRCARLLSEFSYDSFSFNDVAGSLTNPKNRKTYFTNTLGYTENEYNTLRIALSDNHNNANAIDFTHLQYSLSARLAYALNKDGLASNLGSQFKTGNWGIYSDEDISYLGGWLGDATLRNDSGTGVPVLKNDDYMADLDAENIYRLILQGYSSIDALNTYYLNMNSSNTRANIFLQYIPYSIVKQKIFYELIDAQLYIFMSNASSQGDIVMTKYWLNLIDNEQYHFDEIKSKYPDTYDFLMSLEDRLLTIAHY